MRFSRRVFGSSVAITAAAGLLGSRLLHSKSKQTRIVAGYKKGDRPHPDVALGDNYLVVFDPLSKTEKVIKVHGDVHSVESIDGRYVVAFPKFQDTASIVDLEGKSETRTFTATDGHLFSGHGVVDQHSGRMFVAEVHAKTKDGRISVRSVVDGDRFFDFPSPSMDPHQMVLTESSKGLVIANGDGEGSLSLHSLEDGSVVNKVLAPDPHQRFRHLVRLSDDRYLVGSWPRENSKQPASALIYDVRMEGHEVLSFEQPNADDYQSKVLPNFYLSVASNGGGVVGATSPGNSSLTFWSIADRRISKIVHLEQAMSLTFDKEAKVFVAIGMFGQVRAYASETLSEITAYRDEGSFAQGSHALILA